MRRLTVLLLLAAACHASPAMAACVYQAIGALESHTSSSPSPDWPTHQADDIGFLIIETQGGQSVAAVSGSNPPTGWNAISDGPIDDVADATGSRFTIFWKRATSGAEASVSIGDSGDHQMGIVVTFRGCTTTGDPWDDITTATKAVADTTAVAPSVSTTVANTGILIACSRPNDSGAPAFGAFSNANFASISERHDAGALDGNGGGILVVTATYAGTGASGTSTSTMTSLTDTCYTISVKEATAASTPPPRRAIRL